MEFSGRGSGDHPPHTTVRMLGGRLYETAFQSVLVSTTSFLLPYFPLLSARDILLLGRFPNRSDTLALLVVLVAVTAHAVSRAHWNFVFEESPSLAGVVAAKPPVLWSVIFQ
ncbi:hypothetical protein F4703DRAFT_1928022 [Phycomyces blakesleeanus]